MTRSLPPRKTLHPRGRESWHQVLCLIHELVFLTLFIEDPRPTLQDRGPKPSNFHFHSRNRSPLEHNHGPAIRTPPSPTPRPRASLLRCSKDVGIGHDLQGRLWCSASQLDSFPQAPRPPAAEEVVAREARRVCEADGFMEVIMCLLVGT
ncbi:hypothetical protein DOTSEDRAFT_30410 [Dothistroma septosporum NZE10]|uniref:Uncharacterized protein n=1 Tax=Dothistroma septosporum (strain NZE10 / CBS 128990) TaxID=675120 RepID=N1Q1G0_DOTSN|nr:hypothetical protein DOTSEDRAFT_30410 [Dothistroma septosporum NZE10]